MRFILTMVIWVVILGGLTAYNRHRLAAEASVVVQAPTFRQAMGEYTIVVTPTFSMEADPFALQTADSAATAMELRLNGENITLPAESLQRGEPWSSPQVQGLVEGDNELYIQASPPMNESDLQHGVRLQLLDSGVAVVDQTLWSNQGSLVSGTLHFQIETMEKEHDH